MFYTSYRRSSLWHRAARPVLYITLFLTLLDIFRLLSAHRTFSNNLALQTITHHEDLPRDIQNQQIYIVAQFWTSEFVLVDFWLTQFQKLVTTLPKENIYVSILASKGLDNTADAIHWLDEQLERLGIERTIIVDPTSHGDVVNASSVEEQGHTKPGWIETGSGKELRRIPYLSEMRNRGLEPMLAMQEMRTFDKILYLNDVYFEPSDILTLLNTNEGHFDVACGVDFHYPPAFYDTFALRDSEGRGPVMATFPYFRAAETRNAIMQGHPAKVMSCWNGVLVVDAAPYYNQITTRDGRSYAKAGLRFRGVPDSLAEKHLEASECCLIHADLLASGTVHKGIYINPAVRVGYTREAYELTHVGLEKGFVSRFQYITGVWKNRLARYKSDGISSSAGQNMAEIYRRIRQWDQEGANIGEKRSEVGGYCTIDEMHILIWNGWKHVW